MAAVLIGGKARRFGTDKVVAPFRDKLLIEHVTDVIQPLFEEIVLIGHPREHLRGFRVIEDIRPGFGPLGGIFTALSSATTLQCFVFAADMPNLNTDFISHMISSADDHDIVLPVWSQGREPLHAIYHKRVLPRIEDLLNRHEKKIFSLLTGSDTLIVDEPTIRSFGRPEEIFANINTQHDIPVPASQ